MYHSVILVAFVGFICNVNAQVDTTKYTVSLNFETLGNRCVAGIIADNFLISSGECFASPLNEPVKVPSISAIAEGVNGKVEVKVEAVYLPYFYSGRLRAIHDFAVVKLKESLNLEKNGLFALRLPQQSSFEMMNEYKGTVASVSTPGERDPQKVEVVHSQECSAKAFNLLMSASQFCAKLHNSSHKCSGQRGSPVVEGDDLLIGVQLRCQDGLPFELFSKVAYFRNTINIMLTGTPGPYSSHNYA